jgi:hypothetical protein
VDLSGMTKTLSRVAAVIVFLCLFWAYLRLSQTYAENADMANILLMASDMLHGNVLLSGWHMSDVSFYTTELPQYALLESFLGVHMETAHVAAAMTYTLTLLLAVLLAKGGTSGGEAAARVLIVGAIMLAPQLGGGVLAVDLNVGHIGTSVPLLLIWLLLDRAGSRQWVPVLTAILLAWVLIADPIVEIAALVPLGVVCMIRIARDLTRREPGWYEASLIGASGAAAGIAWYSRRLLDALGGYEVQRVGFLPRTLAQLPAGVAQGTKQVLALFGADPVGLQGVQEALALLHLVSVVLVGVAFVVAISRFFRVTLVDQVLVVAVVVLVLAYVGSTASDEGAHEIAMVLPFAAVLTARMLAAPVLTAPVLAAARPALVSGIVAGALVLGGYLAGFGYELGQPSTPPEDSALASWLVAHHLSYGLAGYWDSSSVTVDSGGRVTVRAVNPATLTPALWMSDQTWYDPKLHDASFLVLDGSPNPVPPAVRREFGAPARTYHVGQYTIFVWNANLLRYQE